jgi:Family of unknown function (DUF6713)
MDSPPVVRLYLLNLTLLVTHEIDSAYWHEWEMFHLPGGIELFLILHLFLLAIFFYGLVQVAQSGHYAKTFSYLLAGVGLFAFAIHMTFLVLGYPQFRSPVSAGLLFAILAVSIAQIAYTHIRKLRIH